MGRNGDGECGREALGRRKFLRMGMLGTVATAGGLQPGRRHGSAAGGGGPVVADRADRKVGARPRAGGPRARAAAGLLVQDAGAVRFRDDRRVHHAAASTTAWGCSRGPRRQVPASSGTTSSARATTSPPGTVIGDPDTAYDRKAPGGTTTLEVDDHAEPDRALHQPERHRHELLRDADAVGHLAHVRGNHGRRSTTARSEPHGYVFEVDAFGDAPPMKPSPIKEMGRFVHEAGAVDPRHRRRLHDRGQATPTASTGSCPNVPGEPRQGRSCSRCSGVKGQAGYNTVIGQTRRGRAPGRLDRHRRSRTLRTPRTTRRTVFRRGPSARAAPSSWAARAAPVAATVGRVRLARTAATTGSARSGSTRRRSEHRRAERGGRARAPVRVARTSCLDGPDNMCTSPSGGDRDRRGRQRQARTSSAACCPTARSFPIAENLVAGAAAADRRVGQAVRPVRAGRRPTARRRARPRRSSPVRGSARTASGCS